MHEGLYTLHVLTATEGFGLFRYQPMTSINVDEAEAREELADQRERLVRDVFASGPAYEQGRLPESNFLRVLEGEVSQISQGFCECR